MPPTPNATAGNSAVKQKSHDENIVAADSVLGLCVPDTNKILAYRFAFVKFIAADRSASSLASFS
jgi:hypothetical protein